MSKAKVTPIRSTGQAPAAKKAPKKSAQVASKATADTTPGLEKIRIKYDPVMIALSKAEAARLLLVDVEIDGSDDVVDWINSFAATALHEALDEARAAYSKTIGDKVPPAAEPAR